MRNMKYKLFQQETKIFENREINFAQMGRESKERGKLAAEEGRSKKD